LESERDWANALIAPSSRFVGFPSLPPRRSDFKLPLWTRREPRILADVV